MKAVIEGLLFLSGDEGLTLEQISNIIEEDIEKTKQAIKELYEDYKNIDRGIQLEFLGNHFKLTTKQEHKDFYKKLILEKDNFTLSQSILEVLAIVAYNSPITRIDIDNIRGVNSSYLIRKLLLKGLIEEVGRSDAPGKPRLYGITSNFLDYFGLGSIQELPKVEKKEIVDEKTNLFNSNYKEEKEIV